MTISVLTAHCSCLFCRIFMLLINFKHLRSTIREGCDGVNFLRFTYFFLLRCSEECILLKKMSFSKFRSRNKIFLSKWYSMTRLNTAVIIVLFAELFEFKRDWGSRNKVFVVSSWESPVQPNLKFQFWNNKLGILRQL